MNNNRWISSPCRQMFGLRKDLGQAQQWQNLRGAQHTWSATGLALQGLPLLSPPHLAARRRCSVARVAAGHKSCLLIIRASLSASPLGSWLDVSLRCHSPALCSGLPREEGQRLRVGRGGDITSVYTLDKSHLASLLLLVFTLRLCADWVFSASCIFQQTACARCFDWTVWRASSAGTRRPAAHFVRQNKERRSFLKQRLKWSSKCGTALNRDAAQQQQSGSPAAGGFGFNRLEMLRFQASTCWAWSGK